MNNIKTVIYEGCRTLLVVFTSRGSKEGEFSFYKTISLLKCSTIFIRNSKDDWYVNGIDCFADNLDDSNKCLSELINNFISNNGIERVVFMGSSMGAYGAVRCTNNIDITVPYTYLLFSLESPLLLPGSKSISNKSEIDISESTDILPFLSDKKGVLFFGEYDVIDSYTALRIKESYDNIEVISHKHSGHNVPEKLNEDWSIVKYITNFLNDEFTIVNSGLISDKLSSCDLLLLAFMISDNRLDSVFLHDLINRYPDFGLVLNRLGVMYHNQNDYELAFDFIKKSLAVYPKYENSLLHYNLLLDKMSSNEPSA